MTIEVKSPAGLTVALSGCGEVCIDWGDGNETATELFPHFSEYSHQYEKMFVCTIIITGDDITGLICPEIESIERVETDTDDPYIYFIHANRVTELNVSNINHLLELRCCNAELQNIDVSRNSKLQKLHCDNNRLIVLDVSNNSGLIELSCSRNKLTSLDVSRCSALKKLDCSNNRIPAMDVSHNPALETANWDSDENIAMNEKMQTLIIPATSEMPYVCFDALNWTFEMTGRGTPKNAASDPFFLKLSDWLQYWFEEYQQINSTIIVNFRLDYCNDEFYKWLNFYVFRKLNNFHGKGRNNHQLV